MSYIENPKTKGSGILCAIPQNYKRCTRECSECFFQNGRSYLEPLAENLPNIPFTEDIYNYVIRVNDGLDSSDSVDEVIERTKHWPRKFYNTSSPHEINKLSEHGPIVLTLNPGDYIDKEFWKPDENIYKVFMFVRFLANPVNSWLLARAVDEWCNGYNIPLVITFMRYYNKDNAQFQYFDSYYNKKEHILNPSWSLNQDGWDMIYGPYRDNPLVSTCGFSASEHLCKRCGVCLREYNRFISANNRA